MVSKKNNVGTTTISSTFLCGNLWVMELWTHMNLLFFLPLTTHDIGELQPMLWNYCGSRLIQIKKSDINGKSIYEPIRFCP